MKALRLVMVLGSFASAVSAYGSGEAGGFSEDEARYILASAGMANSIDTLGGYMGKLMPFEAPEKLPKALEAMKKSIKNMYLIASDMNKQAKQGDKFKGLKKKKNKLEEISFENRHLDREVSSDMLVALSEVEKENVAVISEGIRQLSSFVSENVICLEDIVSKAISGEQSGGLTLGRTNALLNHLKRELDLINSNLDKDMVKLVQKEEERKEQKRQAVIINEIKNQGSSTVPILHEIKKDQTMMAGRLVGDEEAVKVQVVPSDIKRLEQKMEKEIAGLKQGIEGVEQKIEGVKQEVTKLADMFTKFIEAQQKKEEGK
ncbi:MAG: hypothetical protein LBG13_01300 [Holosporales bacterium]|nr:hypothetical protein [Holosporales bacterium]